MRIKIINVITDSNIAGAGIVLLTLLKHYDRKRFDMIVVLPENSLLIEPIQALGIRCIEAAGIAEASFSVKAIMPLRKIFAIEKPDVVHTHASVSARIAARLYGKCKIIYMRHSVFEPSKRSKHFPFKQLLGFVNNALADVIIAVSPAAKDNIVETGTNPDKIRIVFNGVNSAAPISDEEKKTAVKKLGLTENEFICCILARLEDVKGHEYILKAAKLLQEKDSSVRIIIAGTGSRENELKSTADKLGLKNCIFLGFVKDVQTLENIMHLQLNASYGTEATSMALLEGMSLGVPAVVSDFGGNPYVIRNGKNGLVIPQKDENAICEAILKLKNDKHLYNEMHKNALAIYNEGFTAQGMTNNIEKIYAECGGRKK